MVRQCETCAHWQRKSDGSGHCGSPMISTEGKLPSGEGAVAGGYEGYGDYFVTGPRFGCIHHTEKERTHG